ncbi:MAG: class IIb bacteriocin, lactobin A/cerein 7B family [Pseudoxanthomonas sp.]|nr:class IIb bacteriocin, lactobin A/cerein 7B family [Pseudoxanthomonas sp.]
MRELSVMEIDAVNGGIAPLLVVGGVLGVAAIAVVAYAAYKGCDASVEIGKEGIKLQVECKATE